MTQLESSASADAGAGADAGADADADADAEGVEVVVAVEDGTSAVGEAFKLVALLATDVGEATRFRLSLSSERLSNIDDITFVSSTSRNTEVKSSTHCQSLRRTPCSFREFEDV